MEIKIQSIIDVITNSSTEIYINASERTVQGVKNIINSLLKIGNNELSCDDLFEVKLSLPTSCNFESNCEDWYNSKSSSESQVDYEDIPEETAEYYYNEHYKNDHDDTFADNECRCIVKAKNPNDNEVAEILSHLHNLFDYDAYYS